MKYDILYNSATQHIATSIDEFNNADKLLSTTSNIHQTTLAEGTDSQCDMLDIQCAQAEKRAEENAKLAIAMLNGIPDQFKNTPEVRRAQILLLKKQIAYNVKKGNAEKAESLVAKLDNVLAGDKSLTATERKRQIEKLRVRIREIR